MLNTFLDSKCSKCDRYASCVKGDCVCNDDYIGDGLTCRKKITSTFLIFQTWGSSASRGFSVVT
jgi:hypothetical protein